MQSKAAPGSTPSDTDRELDRALASGPLRDIVIPPCPELLIALRSEMDKADPDPQVIADIASRDVAMSASLIRTANSPYYARSRPVISVNEALSLLGLRMTERILTAFLTRNSIRISSPLLEHFWETSTRRALATAVASHTASPEDHMKAVDQLTGKLVGLQIADSSQLQAALTRAVTLNWSVLILGIVLGIVIAMRISGSIVRPLNEAAQVAQNIAGGDLSNSISTGGKDEVGVMLTSLSAMQSNLAKLVSDVRHGSEGVATASSEI